MQILRQLIERMKDQWDRQATIRELRQLSARQLCDIGIDPDQIENVVDGILKARREKAVRSADAPPVRGRLAAGDPRTRVRGGPSRVRLSERCC